MHTAAGTATHSKFSLQPKSLPHLWRSASQHAVEDVIVPLLSVLTADARPLQQVVRDMATHHLELGEWEGGKGGGEGEGEGEGDGGVKNQRKQGGGRIKDRGSGKREIGKAFYIV